MKAGSPLASTKTLGHLWYSVYLFLLCFSILLSEGWEWSWLYHTFMWTQGLLAVMGESALSNLECFHTEGKASSQIPIGPVHQKFRGLVSNHLLCQSKSYRNRPKRNSQYFQLSNDHWEESSRFKKVSLMRLSTVCIWKAVEVNECQKIKYRPRHSSSCL